MLPEIKKDMYVCKFCNKSLSTKYKLANHMEICPKKEIANIVGVYQEFIATIKEKDKI